jgi:hypothetical protein
MGIGGTWYNELGSTMTLTPGGPAPGTPLGPMVGTYQSGVGVAGQFASLGSFDPNNNTFGIVVTWNNGTVERNSTTTWCGQYFYNGGNEILITMWLLCGSTAQSATWDSTLVGQDVFMRIPPSQAKIDAKRALRAPAHPRAIDA